MSSVLQDLTAQRDAVLAEHIAAERAHDIERALKTFRTPHYYELTSESVYFDHATMLAQINGGAG